MHMSYQIIASFSSGHRRFRSVAAAATQAWQVAARVSARQRKRPLTAALGVSLSIVVLWKWVPWVALEVREERRRLRLVRNVLFCWYLEESVQAWEL